MAYASFIDASMDVWKANTNYSLVRSDEAKRILDKALFNQAMLRQKLEREFDTITAINSADERYKLWSAYQIVKMARSINVFIYHFGFMDEANRAFNNALFESM